MHLITMHGFFDLKEGQVEGDFARAYDAFAERLIGLNLIVGSRAMRRRPNPNYDSSPPATQYYISMDFADMEMANACWDHIEHATGESVKLHRSVYARIRNAAFFLSEDLGAA